MTTLQFLCAWQDLGPLGVHAMQGSPRITHSRPVSKRLVNVTQLDSSMTLIMCPTNTYYIQQAMRVIMFYVSITCVPVCQWHGFKR